MKIKIKALLLLISLIFGMLPLASCDKAEKKFTEYSFDYFDTVTTFIGYEKSEEEFDAVCADVFALLEEYHKLFDIYTVYDGINNLATVNRMAGVEAVEVNSDITFLISSTPISACVCIFLFLHIQSKNREHLLNFLTLYTQHLDNTLKYLNYLHLSCHIFQHYPQTNYLILHH